MNEDQLLQIWDQYADKLNIANIVDYVFRLLAWWIIKILALFLDLIQNVANEIVTLHGFFDSQGVTSFINRFEPILWVLLAGSLGFVGMQLMFQRHKHRSHIFTNLLLAVSLLVGLPLIMTKISAFTIAGIEAVNPETNQQISDKIIKDNVSDMILYDKNKFSLDPNPPNNINGSDIRNIDVNETIDPKNAETEVLKQRMTYSETGMAKATELEDGWLQWDERYYRWDVNFITIIVTLGVTFVALLLSSIKVGRIIFELAFNQFFAMLVAVSDISSGQRTKQIVSHIFTSMVLVFFIAVMFQFYFLWSSWITSMGSGFVQLVLLVAGSWALIDGPNSIERILGVDAGLSSSYKAARAAKSITEDTAKAAYGAVSSAVDGSKKALNKVGDMMENQQQQLGQMMPDNVAPLHDEMAKAQETERHSMKSEVGQQDGLAEEDPAVPTPSDQFGSEHTEVSGTFGTESDGEVPVNATLSEQMDSQTTVNQMDALSADSLATGAEESVHGSMSLNEQMASQQSDNQLNVPAGATFGERIEPTDLRLGEKMTDQLEDNNASNQLIGIKSLHIPEGQLPSETEDLFSRRQPTFSTVVSPLKTLKGEQNNVRDSETIPE